VFFLERANFGFRPNRGTIDAAFIARKILKKAKNAMWIYA